jgi:hypothetical protein
MPGTFLGAAPDELDALARTLTGHAGDLTGIGTKVAAGLQTTTWSGPDLTAFHARWQGELLPSLGAAARTLESVAATLRRQAGQQRTASADSGWKPQAFALAGLVTGPGAPGGPGDPGDAPGAPGGQQFVIGPPTPPSFSSPDGFKYDPHARASFGDYTSWAKWNSELVGAEVLKPSLSDATKAYQHYVDNSGAPMTIDYAKAYHDDANIRQAVDLQSSQARAAADRIAASGNTTFSITGDGVSISALNLYPSTEDWQKTLGDHQIWTSGKVSVVGGVATMVVTVHARDRYNFNPGMHDIATGAPDDENGRFAVLGWAKAFDTSGQLSETVRWTVGDPGHPTVVTPVPTPGRVDGR